MNHSLSNFIVGPSNRLAYQVATAIADNPNGTYNPFLIRAAAGLGKTHLLHAVREHIKQHKTACRVTYVTPDGLSRRLHNAIRSGHVETLRDQYLKTDILMVDDVQDIAGRQHTQGMLLHILDEFMSSGRQVVVATSTMPRNIPSLEPRLCSRLGCSLVVEIRPPEPETCRKILHHKASLRRIELPDSVIELLVSATGANIRELEHHLTGLAAFASLHGRPIDDDLVLEMLQRENPTSERQISMIQQTVATYFGVRIADLKTKRRPHVILVPRQIAMFLSHELTSASPSEIGRLFGGRSSASVQHACRRIERLTRSGAGVSRPVQALRDMLGNSHVDNSGIGFPQDDLKEECG